MEELKSYFFFSRFVDFQIPTAPLPTRFNQVPYNAQQKTVIRITYA